MCIFLYWLIEIHVSYSYYLILIFLWLNGLILLSVPKLLWDKFQVVSRVELEPKQVSSWVTSLRLWIRTVEVVIHIPKPRYTKYWANPTTLSYWSKNIKNYITTKIVNFSIIRYTQEILSSLDPRCIGISKYEDQFKWSRSSNYDVERRYLEWSWWVFS